MKRQTRILLALAATLPSVLSCTTDTYDKGEGEYSTIEAQMAEIHVDRTHLPDYLTTDDGERLLIKTPVAISWTKTADSTYRAMTYFTRTANGIHLTSANRVAVAMPKPITDLMTDPVRFESAWISGSGIYLNTCIYLMLGATDDDEAIHTLGCHKDTVRHNADGTTTQLLTLYHDQGGVPEYYSRRTYISIPLYGIETDSICLCVNTYKGLRTCSVPRGSVSRPDSADGRAVAEVLSGQ